MQAITEPATVDELHARYRLARRRLENGGVARQAAPPANVTKIEIRDSDPVGETGIPVTACNGQIVIVTESRIIEAKAFFEKAIKAGALPRISIEKIQRAVCKKYNIRLDEMRSVCRSANIVRPRQVAMFLSREITLRSYPRIGQYFGDRDHTTIYYAHQKIASLITKDEALKTIVNELHIELCGEMAQ